ncbi:hypothetical protein LOB93_06365 [Lactobacillus delbrueckii subsp. lactis]|nr:hypothetical protein [Lactobacillus delbrueckii]MCD5451903.1 hypothetical protein [Lactobacillus delbrueckii subsp. lactis]
MSDQRRRVITVALMLSNVMSGLDNTIINTDLPRIIADLHGIEYTGCSYWGRLFPRRFGVN